MNLVFSNINYLGAEYYQRLMAQYPNIQDHIIHDVGHMASSLSKKEYNKVLDNFLENFI